jgi:uncharacterized RDD family membrane protein YckC
MMTEQMQPIDSRIEIITAENTAFQYRVGGPFRRGIAYFIDLAIRLFIMGVASIVLLLIFGVAGLPGVSAGVILLIYFVLDWFYGGLFETYWNGQTPGKKLLQLRVMSVTGQPVSGWQAILRNVMRAFDMWPVVLFPTGQVGLAAMTFNRRFQRLGDMISGTIVVIEEPAALFGVNRIVDPQALELAMDIPARYKVSRSQAKALSSYVARRGSMGGARRGEIARHLGEPLRIKFGLPPETNLDLLLCALYHRAFIADLGEDVSLPGPFQGLARGPFQLPPTAPQPAAADLVVPTTLTMRPLPPTLSAPEPAATPGGP